MNLKFIWDVVSQIKVGKAGQAYVVDGQGALIAHPDISLVLQKTDLSRLAQVKAALAAPRPGDRAEPRDRARPEGPAGADRPRTIPSLRWTVFVEQPLEEAFAPLRGLGPAHRGAARLLGIVLSVRRQPDPGAEHGEADPRAAGGRGPVRRGQPDHRIEVRTGDELEGLAEQFNRMAGSSRSPTRASSARWRSAPAS